MSMSDIMQRWRAHQWEELVKMQQENCLLDATIVCGDNIHCQAHSAVLAASSKVLRQALREDLTITSDLPSSIWLIIINFIYTGELAYSEGEKFDFDMLMTTAKWLDMHTLVELIEAHSNMKSLHARQNARAAYPQDLQQQQQQQAQQQQQQQQAAQYIPGRPGQKNMPVFNDTKVLDLQESLDFLYDDCAVDKVQQQQTTAGMQPAAAQNEDYDDDSQVYNDNLPIPDDDESNEPPEYRCPHCEYCTPDVNILKTHVQQNHAGQRHVYICCICITAFPSREGLHEHFTTHSADPYLQQQPYCPVCSEMHITTEKLLMHMEMHKDPQKNINMGDGTNVPYCCHICDLIFGSKNALKLHLATHEPNSPYKCGMCAREFKRKSGLQDHMYSGHGNGPARPRGRGVGGRGRYVNPNSRRVERKAKEIYTCEHCGETFTKKTGYMIHRGTHYGKYPYCCKKCSFGATSMSQLEVHMKLHNLPDGQKKLLKQMQRFFCFICGLRFHRRQLFINHFHQIHKETDDLRARLDGADGLPQVPEKFDIESDRYACFHCVFHSSNLDEICDHYPKHFYEDGEISICEEALPYTTSRRSEESFLCDTCGESFSKKLRYINHVMTHSGPEKCGDCPYEARHKWDLLKHRRKEHKSAAKQTSEDMQTRGISSKCVVCGSLFGTYTRLLDHFHFDHKKFEHLHWLVKKYEIKKTEAEKEEGVDEEDGSKKDGGEGDGDKSVSIKREKDENGDKAGKDEGDIPAHKIKKEKDEDDGKVSATVDTSEVSSKVRLNIKVPMNLAEDGGGDDDDDDDDEDVVRTHRKIVGKKKRGRKRKGSDVHHLNIKVPIKMPKKEGDDSEDDSKEYHLNIKVPIKVAGNKHAEDSSDEEDDSNTKSRFKRPVPRKVKKATLDSIQLPDHLFTGIKLSDSNDIEELYNCFHCTFVSADPRDVLEHYMSTTHLEADNNEYECEVCDEVFECKEDVLAHCSECTDVEHNQLEMKLSVDKMWYHDTKDDNGEMMGKRYKCWKCNEMFDNPKEVVLHQKQEHVVITDEMTQQQEQLASMASDVETPVKKGRGGYFTHFSTKYTRSFKNKDFNWPKAKDMRSELPSPFPIVRGRGRPKKKHVVPEVKHVQNLYQCKHCGKAYMSIANVEKHCIENHNDKDAYSSMAVDATQTPQPLQQNGDAKQNLNLLDLKTEQNGSANPQAEGGAAEAGTSEDGAPKPANSKKVQLYKCKYCFLLFPTVPQVKAHVKEEHNTKKKKQQAQQQAQQQQAVA